MNITGGLNLDGYRRSAELAVKQHFSSMYDSHAAEAHRRKREDAHQVIDLGDDAKVPHFALEASRLGLSLRDFADLILSKPDEFYVQETKRRMLIERIRTAATKQEIDVLLGQNGVSMNTNPFALQIPLAPIAR